MCTYTYAHTLRDQLRGKYKHFIFQVAPASAHRPCHSCSALPLLVLGLSPALIGTRHGSHHRSVWCLLLALDWLPSDTHFHNLWSPFSLLMLRPSFTPAAGTKDIRITITNGLTQIADTKFRHIFLSSSGIGTLEHIDGERVRLCGKRVKKRFNKKNG